MPCTLEDTMHLFDLPTGIPWLSLIWLSMPAPAFIMMFLKPEQKQAIRVVGTSFAFISLALSLLVFFAYDYSSAQKFQFVEELPWLPQIGINYILAVDGLNLPMLILNGFVIFTGALMSWNIENRAREYWILLLILTSGVYGVFVSVDLFLFFVFYELAVLPMYLLIGIWGSTRKEYGAMKLTLYLMGGSAFVILGMVGVYGCLRAAMWLMPEGAHFWLLPIAILTLINAVYGATIAMTQRDFKFMIGYSSVSHMGLVVFGLAAANEIGLLGAVLQMFAHGIMTALFFAVVGRMVYDRKIGRAHV